MNLVDQLNETLAYIRNRTGIAPKIGVILGSGLGDIAESSKDDVVFSFNELPHFPRSTCEGHRGNLIIGRLSEKPVIVMQGRIHFYEGYSASDLVYPVRLMKFLGVEYLIITSAAGGVNPRCKTGDIVFIKDHINLMGVSPLAGIHHPQFGDRFPDMSVVYRKDLRSLGLSVARRERIRAFEGIYVASAGPQYETPAEIRAFRKLGGDIVGMSVVPEAIAASQMGMKVLAFSFIANAGAGISKKPISHRGVIKAGQAVSRKAAKLIAGITAKIQVRDGS